MDDVRLNSQIGEALVGLPIVNHFDSVSLCPRVGWEHHLAFRMWHGHPHHLLVYTAFAIDEFERRDGRVSGYRQELERHADLFNPTEARPRWLGCALFHIRMRQNLLGKDPSHYSGLGAEWADLQSVTGYAWPMRNKRTGVWTVKDVPSKTVLILDDLEYLSHEPAYSYLPTIPGR